MFGIQPLHIIIIVIVAFLIFGGNKLPELGRSAGKAISEFRKGTKDMTDSFREEVNPNGSSQATQPPPLPTTPNLNVTTPPQASSGDQARRFCIQCGAPNPTEARFCSSCGTKFPEQAA
jgi:sec-independent protein translocase protein TatA